MTDITIYFAPDTCARVSMIALEETGHPYRAELVRFMAGQHRSPEFLALNPSGRVPTLVVDGKPLTENVAILQWLADRFPDAGLLPPAADPFDRAQHTSDLAFCSSNLHPVVTRLRFPTFFAKEPEALPGVFTLAEEAMRRVLLPVEQRLGEGQWWYGDRWSVIDAYVNWVWFRISGTAFATDDFPNLRRHQDDLMARPAVQRALARHTDAHQILRDEGLVVPLPPGERRKPGMTLIRQGAGPNPLVGFRVEEAAVTYVGHDLQRPECILAECDGTLWAADARGGVMRIDPDGRQELIVQQADLHFDLAGDATASLLGGTLPNGLAFAANGDFLISNFGTDRLERMTRTGETRVLLDRIDGRPLGKVNFVLRDRRDRIWITVSTQTNPWSKAVDATLADGSIVLVDERGSRIVADGFHFTNEIRFDAAEEWLYVAETSAKRVTRLRVRPDGSLTDREVYGPASLGTGLVDGIAFDAYGNLWATMIFAERLVAITPDGDLLELLDTGDPAATAAFERAFAAGGAVPFELMLACHGTLTNWMASVTFGGPDLSTVYLGSLRGHSIPRFRSPVAGLPMIHW